MEWGTTEPHTPSPLHAPSPLGKKQLTAGAVPAGTRRRRQGLGGGWGQRAANRE